MIQHMMAESRHLIYPKDFDYDIVKEVLSEATNTEQKSSSCSYQHGVTGTVRREFIHLVTIGFNNPYLIAMGTVVGIWLILRWL